MSSGPNRGLAGKARRAHYRSRASRLYAQQHIAEYLDPESGHSTISLDRPIPIGHRREFLPSAAPGHDDAMGDQLELKLTDVETVTDGTIRIVPPAKAATVTASGRSKNGNTVRHVDKQTRPVSHADAPRKRVSGQTFTLQGFLCGCAVGGAAAAIVLLLWQVVLR